METGSSLATLLASRWGNATFNGTWEDGTTTTATVKLDPLPENACRAFERTSGLELTANVSYETADGRLKPHSAKSTTQVYSLGDALHIEFRTDERFACNDPAFRQLDPSVDCASVDSITFELDLYYDARPGYNNAGRIVVIEFGKPPAATQVTHTLMFDPDIES